MKKIAEKKSMTEVAELVLKNDGILRVTFHHKNALTAHDLKKTHSGITKIFGDAKAAVLVKIKNPKDDPGMTREARVYGTGDEASKLFKALAILVANPMTRVTAGFLIQLNKPSFPIKTFTSEDVAVKWLSQF